MTRVLKVSPTCLTLSTVDKASIGYQSTRFARVGRYTSTGKRMGKPFINLLTELELGGSQLSDESNHMNIIDIAIRLEEILGLEVGKKILEEA